MKKLVVLSMGLCVAMAFTSCKSSESAYKKAYEKAKQQELAEGAAAQDAPAEVAAVEAAPVVSAPPVSQQAVTPVESDVKVREERVELVSGNGLKAYSVVCGSFGVKANAEGLKSRLETEGYNALVVYNAAANTYRVITASFDTRAEAAQAREEFKAKHPSNADFQKSWLLYKVN